MFPLGLWSNLLRFFDAADTEAENKKEQQIAIRIGFFLSFGYSV